MIKEDKLNYNFTEDDIYAIGQALRHCYKQSAYILKQGTNDKEENPEEDEIDYGELYCRFNGKQILENQKLRELIETKIKELDKKGTELFNQGTQDYETDILQSLLQSLLDEAKI